MARLTLRLDNALRDRLLDRSSAIGITPSAFLRDLIIRFEGADPTGHHARFDELHATSLQTLAILATLTAETAPKALEKGMADARVLLRERGLLDPEQADARD